MASDNSVKSQLEAFKAKFESKLQETPNDLNKNLLENLAKVNKKESLYLPVNIKSKLKLHEEVTKCVIMAPSHEGGFPGW